MRIDESSPVTTIATDAGTDEFLDDVISALSETPRRLPCKYFYDERGSALFDEICELDEYYLTRTELDIMRRWGPEIAARIAPGSVLLEFGSGSSIKTRILLDHLGEVAAYCPIDVSREHLQRTAESLVREYPDVDVVPICADFTLPFEMPATLHDMSPMTVYFPGSTIGNFDQTQAVSLLSRIASICGRDGGLVVGIDLRKSTDILEAAYNDRRGITAEFNRNLLARINRELDGNFQLDQFAHRAVYDPSVHRIEMHLVADRRQTVTIAGRSFEFDAGQTICTEYSHKYSIESFAQMAASADLRVTDSWTDPSERFAVLHLAIEP